MLSTDVIDFFVLMLPFQQRLIFVLMAAIPDSASVFGYTIAVLFFFYTLKNP